MTMKRMRPIVTFLLLLLLGLASCAGSGSAPDSSPLPSVQLPQDTLPALPTAEATAPLRDISVQSGVSIPGKDWFAASAGVSAQGNAAHFSPAAGQLDWAVYRLGALGSDYVPLSLTSVASGGKGQHYLALANYALGRWEFLPGTFTTGTTKTFGAGWQDYVSPLGNMYAAVMSYGQLVDLQFLQFSVDDTRPVLAPGNLAATPGELSAALSWDSVTDARVSELRIYHSLDPGMVGASLALTVGAAQTETVLSNLDHTVLHYFTIRAYSAVLDQESADSNIASCQPTGPVSETFLPPTNLIATAGPGSADLGWDPYPDPRASHIRVYSGLLPDLSDAVLEAEVDAGETQYTVDGLEAGVERYFAVRAWWQAAALESEKSNIASCTPEAAPFELMDGIWPRFGGDIASSGYSALRGPANLNGVASVSLTAAAARQCATSPVLDARGRVFAISRDAQVSCYSADLQTRHWRSDANDALQDRKSDPLSIPSQAPLLDSDGNIYFVAVEDDGATDQGQGWLLSFDQDGAYNWRFDLGSMSTDPQRPAADLNIVPGALLCAGDDNTVLYGIDQNGNELWNNSAQKVAGRHYHADIALDGAGSIGLPLWLDGIWIDPRPNWASFASADGALQQGYSQLGASEHVFGGIYMPNGLFCYPSGNHLRSLNPADGSLNDESDGIVNMSGAPARSGDGQYIFFAEDQGGGFSGFASFHCNSFSDTVPPLQSTVWGVSTGKVTVSCKPAVDADLSVYFSDDGGTVHRVAWDPQLPPGEGNPLHTFADVSTGFVRSSIALADGAAYVISVDNRLYRITAADRGR